MKLLLTLAASALALAAIPAAAQSSADEARFRTAQERFDREYQLYRQAVDQYQRARAGYADPRYREPAYDNGGYRRAPDPYAPGYEGEDIGEWDPAPYYRPGGQYRERVLSANERVYAGYDGRYYCRRSDGTTGLIVGAAAGGILGNVIDGGRSRIVGTLLGGAGGALAGRAVEQNQVRCR